MSRLVYQPGAVTAAIAPRMTDVQKQKHKAFHCILVVLSFDDTRQLRSDLHDRTSVPSPLGSPKRAAQFFSIFGLSIVPEVCNGCAKLNKVERAFLRKSTLKAAQKNFVFLCRRSLLNVVRTSPIAEE
jgi:hypothetical protein